MNKSLDVFPPFSVLYILVQVGSQHSIYNFSPRRVWFGLPKQFIYSPSLSRPLLKAWLDDWMVGWLDDLMVEWLKGVGWMDGWWDSLHGCQHFDLFGQLDGLFDGWFNGQMVNGWMVGWVIGWLVG